jgi:hypothetical protein
MGRVEQVVEAFHNMYQAMPPKRTWSGLPVLAVSKTGFWDAGERKRKRKTASARITQHVCGWISVVSGKAGRGSERESFHAP